MMFVNPEGVFPLFIGDVQIANKDWKAGDPLPSGWREIEPVPYPETTNDEIAEFLAFEEVDGKLRQVWTVRALSATEIEARDAKATLQQKLRQLDLNPAELAILSQALI